MDSISALSVGCRAALTSSSALLALNVLPLWKKKNGTTLQSLTETKGKFLHPIYNQLWVVQYGESSC